MVQKICFHSTGGACSECARRLGTGGRLGKSDAHGDGRVGRGHVIKSLCQLYPRENKLISLGIKYQYPGIALINVGLIYFFKGISFIPSKCWEIQLIYPGIHFKSQEIGILDLVKSKSRCISLWEHKKYIYINQMHGLYTGNNTCAIGQPYM